MRPNVSGNFRLGYTETSAQQTGALGEEFTIVATEFDTGDDVYVNSNATPVVVKLVKNASGGTLSPGVIVKRKATGNMTYEVEKAGADNPACGVVDPTLQSAVPDGAKFLIVVYGETDVLMGGTEIAKGATIKSGANGLAVVDALSTVADLAAAFGVMLETGTANALRKAMVDFRAIK